MKWIIAYGLLAAVTSYEIGYYTAKTRQHYPTLQEITEQMK